MRLIRLFILAGVLLSLGGTSGASAATGINRLAGLYQGYFNLKINSGNYLVYYVQFKVKSAPGNPPTLRVVVSITAQGIVSYCQGTMDSKGNFVFLQIPNQAGLGKRSFSIGGLLGNKTTAPYTRGVFQFSNPGNNTSNALDAPTQNGDFFAVTKISDL